MSEIEGLGTKEKRLSIVHLGPGKDSLQKTPECMVRYRCLDACATSIPRISDGPMWDELYNVQQSVPHQDAEKEICLWITDTGSPLLSQITKPNEGARC